MLYITIYTVLLVPEYKFLPPYLTLLIKFKIKKHLNLKINVTLKECGTENQLKYQNSLAMLFSKQDVWMMET